MINFLKIILVFLFLGSVNLRAQVPSELDDNNNVQVEFVVSASLVPPVFQYPVLGAELLLSKPISSKLDILFSSGLLHFTHEHLRRSAGITSITDRGSIRSLIPVKAGVGLNVKKWFYGIDAGVVFATKGTNTVTTTYSKTGAAVTYGKEDAIKTRVYAASLGRRLNSNWTLGVKGERYGYRDLSPNIGFQIRYLLN